MNARVLLLIAPCALVACEPKKEAKPSPPPPPGTPVVTAHDGGAVPTPTPSAPLPGLATDPGGATGAAVWGVAVGGLATDAPRDIAADAAGNAYVAGYFEGEATFGKLGTRAPTPPEVTDPKPGAKPPLTKADAFVLKLDAAGAPAWVQTFGDTREDVANSVAVDGKGNVAVTGNFLDKVAIGTGAAALAAKAAGSDDIYVAAFAADGAPRWLWTAGGIESDGGNAIAAHPGGGWIVGGSFLGAVELGPHKLKSQGGPDAFLARLADDGDLAWALQLGGTYGDTVIDVATDPSGAIYVLGQFAGSARFGGEPLTATGNAGVDVVLAKYDATGKHLWSTSFGTPLDDAARGIAVDPAGNVTVTGSYEKTMQIGDSSFQSHGESDIFVVRFNRDGALQWSKAWGGTREDVGYALAADASGNTILTGWFQGSVDVGAKESLTSRGNKDVLVVKLDPAGTTLWAKSFGDRDHDQGRGVAVDGKGNPLVTGLFRFALDAVKPPLASVHADGDKAPRTDAFVIKLER